MIRVAPGSGILCLFDPWIRDPGWYNQDPDPGSGSGMNILDHISESLESIFRVKTLKFFDADVDPDRDPGIFWTLDPGSGMEKIRIRDKHLRSPILILILNFLNEPLKTKMPSISSLLGRQLV
jgi:hypothetical protein